MLSILVDPKNSLIKQYEKLFEIEGVKLNFTPDALVEIVEKAIERKTGARALRSILEKSMLDVMYELPTLSGVDKAIVDADAILGKSEVRLITRTGEKVPMPSHEQKSA